MARSVIYDFNIKQKDTGLDTEETTVLDKATTVTINDEAMTGMFTQASGAGARSIFPGSSPSNAFLFNIIPIFDSAEPSATAYVDVVIDGAAAATRVYANGGGFGCTTSCTVQTATANSVQIHYTVSEI